MCSGKIYKIGSDEVNAKKEGRTGNLGSRY